MNTRSVATFCGVMLAIFPAWGGTVLFDFEKEADFTCWTVRSAAQDTWKASAEFVSSGTSSALFATPAWKEGMQGWPAFEVKPPVTDWSPYDRLAFDLVNPTDHAQTLKAFVIDSDTSLQKGASFAFALSPHSYKRITMDLKAFPDHIDRRAITKIHFYLSRPPHPFVFHLDTFTLLKPGEVSPPTSKAFLKDVKEMMFGDAVLQGPREAIKRLRTASGSPQTDNPIVTSWLKGQGEALEADWQALLAKLAAPGFKPEEADTLAGEFNAFNARAERFESLARIRGEWLATGGDAACAVGTATSMEKILPKALPFNLRMSKSIDMYLARNETESFQVVVVPFGKDMKQVRVNVSALKSEQGTKLPDDAVSADVVGYVKTGQPTYEVSHTGWWPDPLLDFLPAVDVAENDAQAFWVRVRAPKDQVPGVYKGRLQVAHTGGVCWDAELHVRVRDFSVPDASPLPTAISLYLDHVKKFIKEDWGTFVPKLSDFLADYYIDYDHLYRNGGPEYDVLKRLDAQGRLRAFNLRYFSANDFPANLSEEEFEKKVAALAADVKKIYADAEKAGIADKAYCYGFDECSPALFPMLERICAELKKVIPDVPLMTTTYDHSYGTKTCIKSMDAWTPLTPFYKLELADQVRKEGKQVWWYICCGPAHPHANWFVEYPAIETRLLMGAMTTKYRPDGFLYYTITRWPNNTKPIESGPFTTWNPASFRTFNGDGSLFCPGPDGRPLPTIRLENFRDGLEDYAYALLLEERVASYRKKWDTLDSATKQRVEEAEKALEVPASLVTTMTEFSRDPQVLYEYRHRLAAMIEALNKP